MDSIRARRHTVVIVDDHPDFLVSIRNLVQVDCDVVAALEDGSQAVEAVCSLNPDVVILDVSMPVLDGFAAARRLRASGTRTEIVFVSATEDSEYALTAHELGASFVVKRRMNQELMKAIRTAAEVSCAGRTSQRNEPDSH